MGRVGFIVLGIAMLTATSPRRAMAQGSEAFTPDAALAKRGQSVFRSRGCEACHTIGKGKQAGPDLAGVTTRRNLDWLRRWLKNPTEMLSSDSTAQAMLAEYNGIKMPALKLTDQDIEGLIHYMAQESAKKK